MHSFNQNTVQLRKLIDNKTKKLVIPIQIMFATHQYILEGTAMRAPTICHILF
ncbi:hypothetical protein FDUTEX481_07680 [Tolypothrix sp. PCC 7601]|nr:hypothetical protein FDUTEX481_07680 [Tolypothrix sp. PCC 7601]